MKILLVVFLLLSFTSYAQPENAIVIDKLPEHILNKDWKWKEGDNENYANTQFDDSGWQTIDPDKDISELPEVPKNGNIFWLRLNFLADTLPQQALALVILQTGASEIYLDGKLIESYGSLTPSVIAFNPKSTPLYLPLGSSGNHVLSVRIALQPKINYTRLYGKTNHLFHAQIMDLKNAIQIDRSYDLRYTNLESYKLGLFFILFVLHLSLFILNRKQLSNLVVAITFFCLGLDYTFKLIGDLTNLVSQTHIFYALSHFFANTNPILLLASLHFLIKRKVDFVFWILAVLIVAEFVTVIVFQAQSIFLSSLVLSVWTFSVFRILIYGIKEKRRGAFILMVGAVVNVLFFVILFTIIGPLITFSPTLADITFNIALIAFPITISIYLAIESAYTNKELNLKISENNMLARDKEVILQNQNQQLELQVNQRTLELSKSLSDLKSTQSQLIQSEKMASLGELTAGIAHEIQNPLNFVNNFSEVSNELIKEIKDIRRKTQDQQAASEEDDLLNDVEQNLEKINHHGKRAADIVKGMLQHSRASSGQKEPTDINALCDEYLRLSYHGLRAKDKSFNAKFETDFDASLPKINVVPQDIGRVILNLINNSFYAVNQQREMNNEQRDPLVIVSTKNLEDKIEIRVTDNGNGIPQNIVDKIFQPFFTTKPTGQGTGLGLSLSYDIVTKGHGGSIEVKTTENGTEFIVKLPA